ncbi:putative leader peptide [Gordonia jinghuaiqii]|nr:putative leader peptide [Gordonia jinghuaiqii]
MPYAAMSSGNRRGAMLVTRPAIDLLRVASMLCL